MVKKRHGRHRPVNPRVSLHVGEFLRKLGSATRFPVPEERLCRTVRPGPIESFEWVGDCADKFSIAYLFSELLSKYDDRESSDAKAASAMRLFDKAEEVCRRTNWLLSSSLTFTTCETGARSIIERARQKIECLLGDLDLNEVYRGMGWGPGASTRLPRRRAAAAYKYSGIPESTIGNAILASAAIAANPLWQEGIPSDGSGLPLSIVGGNRIVTVPKNYRVDRCIAIEPDMNLFVQKGIGRVLRHRLRSAGVNLDDQTVNRLLALKGSADGSLMTVDLSMASDTISYELVRLLLPDQWFALLEQARSPSGVLPSGFCRYQKFSSMGNGYTFELESLIFWALCRSVVDVVQPEVRRVSVYGDDLVLSPECLPVLREVFSVAGFTINEKKTHSEGPFRESCGGHYYAGLDVTPFYIRRPIEQLTDLFLLHNNLYRWFVQQGWNDCIQWTEAYNLLAWLRSHAPSEWRRPRIPDGYGDGAFIGYFDECCPRRAPHWIEGFRCSVLVETALREKGDLPVGRLVDSITQCEEVRTSLHDLIKGVESREPRTVSPGLRYRIVEILVTQFAGVSPLALLASA